jgi:hypothetical protein
MLQNCCRFFRQTLSFCLVSVLSVSYGPGLGHRRHLQILMAIFLPYVHQSLWCNIHNVDRYFQSHTKYFPCNSFPIYLYGMQFLYFCFFLALTSKNFRNILFSSIRSLYSLIVRDTKFHANIIQVIKSEFYVV